MYFRVKLEATASSGRKVLHHFGITAASQGAAAEKLSAMLDYYQPAVAIQVSGAWIDDVPCDYSMLRPSPAGMITRRLMISAVAVLPVNSLKRGRIQLCLTDPVHAIVDYVLSGSDSPPEVWSDFCTFVLANICSASGAPFDHWTTLTFSDRPRMIDGEKPMGVRSRSEFEDFVMPGVPANYMHTQFFPAQALYPVSTLEWYENSFFARTWIHDDDSSVLLTHVLDDYVGGDLLVTVWWGTIAETSGNCVHLFRYAVRADGEYPEDTEEIRRVDASHSDWNIHNDLTWIIPAGDLTRGKILAIRLHRQGASGDDTQPSDTVCYGIALSYLADLTPA